MQAMVVYKNDPIACKIAGELSDLLRSRGLTVETIASQTLIGMPCPHADLAFVLGGDGTLIHTAIDLAGRDIPIVGINLGQVGFLSSIEPDGLTGSLDKILTRDYTIQKRIILKATVMTGNEAIQQWDLLNDIVIKSGAAHPISITIRKNKEFYCSYRGDGLICATPTGSTAYSYSAGGPVVDLALPALVVTPICPHMGNFRSVVVGLESQLEFCLESSYESGLYVDGNQGFLLHKGDNVSIKKSGKEALFVNLANAANAERIARKRKELDNRLVLNYI